MPILDWPFLDALQAGALGVLCIGFALDALARRDRLMGLLSLTCLLVGLRHLVLAYSTQPTVNPDLMDRIQSLLVAFGFLSLCTAMVQLFPRHVPRSFPAWMALAQLPSFIRNLVLSHPSTLERGLHHASNLAYLIGCGAIATWTLRARQEGDPMGRRLFLGVLGVTLPVVVEVASLSLFGIKVRLTGFSLVILAMAIGNSWQWLVVQSIEGRIDRAERETEVWRGLVPGHVFRSDRPSPGMEALFGPDWTEPLKGRSEVSLLGRDGVSYRVRIRPLGQGEVIGWYGREDPSPWAGLGFLSGWTVGLGVDEPTESQRYRTLLEGWGAEVKPWGTVPPREGPYPSVLVWAREPSILAVWREDDLLRRRARWIQVGGPQTEGPHARLDPEFNEEQLRQALERLISRG